MEGRWATLATVVLTVLRVALGTLFIISSYAKLRHPDLFIDAVQNYHMMPEALAGFFGTVLPWAELFVGWCLVLGIFTTFAAVLCIMMTLTFVVANVASFFKDVGEACDCLGDLVNLNHTTSLIVDIVMLSVAGILIHQRKRAGIVGVGHLLKLDRFHLPKLVPLALGIVAVAIAMTVTFTQIPKEKSPWKEGIDSGVENGAVVVLFFWQGEATDFMAEFRLVMELSERYGQSVWVERIDAGMWNDAAERFDVTDFPTMVVIEGKTGKGYTEYPQRFAGAKDRDALMAAVDEVLASKT